MKKNTIKNLMTCRDWITFILALGFAPFSMAADAEFRGRVKDLGTEVGLPEAVVKLIPGGPGETLEEIADLFGRFQFNAIPPGVYTLEASYPGYLPFSESRSYTADELAAEEIPLTPVVAGPGPGATDFASTIEIQIQTRDASSQVGLPDVPFRIRRYSRADPSVLLETIPGFTDADGQFSLRGKPKGFYDFRFNNPADGAILSFYDEIEVGLKGKVDLTTSHSAIANLNPIKSSVTVTAKGADPVDLDAGLVKLKDVFIELLAVSPDLAPPPGFDPMTDDLRDFADELLPPIVVRSDDSGSAFFKFLPPLSYIVTAKKPGYLRSQAILTPDPTGALPATFELPLSLDDRTSLRVVLQSPYFSHDVLGGLGVILEGIEGTATEEFEMIMPATPVIAGTGPEGEALLEAGFIGLLPGRYRASVTGLSFTPERPALEETIARVGIRFRGEKSFAVAQAIENVEVVMIDPIPATIRGRFFVAEERESIGLPDAGLPVPLNRWQGPAYRLMDQAGIEFRESDVALYLHPALSIVSVDADPDGSFLATVLPGFWGINIPSMAGYFGSNYRSVNRSTGETFALGWPYSADPALGLPVHPFGSGAIPINSGDELEIDLFVRKQIYYLDSTILGSFGESPAESLPLTSDGLAIPFSHLSARDGGGSPLGFALFDQNGPGAEPGIVTIPLQPGVSVDGAGTRIQNAGAHFLIPAPPGTHTLDLTHPHFSFTPTPSATFTLPDYGSPGDPLAGAVIPLESVWGDVPGMPDPFSADYDGKHSLTIEFYGKSPGGAPELRFTRDKPEWFHHGDLGDRIYQVDAFVPWRMSDGTNWEIWVSSVPPGETKANWYHAIFDLSGEPSTKVISFNLIEDWGGRSSPPPGPEHILNLVAINHHNPEQKLDGLSAEFPGDLVLTTGATDTTDSHTAGFIPEGITAKPPGWLMAFGPETPPTAYDIEVDTASITPEITVTTRVARGSFLTGTVVVKGVLPRTTIPGIPVTIFNRFGLPLTNVFTNGFGVFSITIPRAEALFVDIRLPGYKPFRIRRAPNSDIDPTPGDGVHDYHLGDLELEELPRPAFLPPGGVGSVLDSFDRAGMFLVGVRKSTDAPLGEDAEAISMRYTIETAAPPKYSLATLPAFDSASGSSGDPVGGPGVMIEDAVRALWIVDPRSFPGNPSSGGETAFTLPAMSDPLYVSTVRTKLREIGGILPPDAPPIDPTKNIFVLKITDLDEVEVSGIKHFKTKPGARPIDLASLPPGLFQPYIIAETARGTFAHFQLKYDGTDPAYKNLFGMKLPPWLAFIADTSATIGAIKEAGEASPLKMGDLFPVDLIELLPSTAGFIQVNDGEVLPGPPPVTEPDDLTLAYTYELSANFAEGTPIPGSGLLGFAPGFAGINARGELMIEVNGSVFGPDASIVGKPTLKVLGGASLEADTGNFFDPSSYLPKAIPKSVRKALANEVKDLGTLKASLTAKVAVQSLDSLEIPFGNGAEVATDQRVIDISTLGGVEVFAEAGVAPFAEKAPYVGPFVRATRRFLKKRGQDFDIRLDSKSIVGAALERKITTRYRVPVGKTPRGFQDTPASSYPGRRNVLSADFRPLKPQTNTSGTQRLCLGYEPGLTLKAGRSNLRVNLKVSGNQCIAPLPRKKLEALSLELNPLGDWPPVKRVTGEVSGTITGTIDAGFFGKRSASWTWGRMIIDVPFNTEESLHLDPFSFAASESGLATVTTDTQWCGAGAHLVDFFYADGDYRIASGSEADALVYTGVESGGGLMSVEVSLRTGPTTWAPPVTVATAAGVLEVAIHELPGGGWIVAWSEVAGPELDAFSPPTTLKWKSFPADLLAETAGGTISSQPGTAFDLCLVPMADDTVGLFWLETLRGAGSVVVDINGATFVGGSWSGVTTLYDKSGILGWDVVGPGFSGSEPARILAFLSPSAFAAGSWSGSGAATPATILDPTLRGELVRVVSGPVDTFLAAYPLEGIGIGLAGKTGAGPWTLLPSPIPGVTPTDLALTSVSDGTDTHFFLAWATENDLGYAYLDETGSLLGSVENIRQAAPGNYSGLAALPVADSHSALLLTRYDNGSDVALRTFTTVEGSGLITLDSDDDSLSDYDEMTIVDADPDDAIKKPLDVLASADFDGDGHSNGDEMGAGTDPTDPDNFPGQAVEVVTAIDTAEEFGGARGLFYLTRAGDFAEPLEVFYSVSGSAVPDVDYTALGGSVTISAGAGNEALFVEPILDALAEGDESIILTITPDAAYAIGTMSSARMVVADVPFDDWRFARFSSAQARADETSGFTIDHDRDQLNTILEYGFFAEPFTQSFANQPAPKVVTDLLTGKHRGQITYLRRTDSLELIYTAEVSNDLLIWTEARPSELTEARVINHGNGSETVTLRSVDPFGPASKRFIRIRVERINH